MGKFANKRLAFTDIETTGLYENEHEIIEIATIIYDPEEDRVIEEWEKKVSPTHIETASPIALKINGYNNDPDSYTGSLKSALIKFNSLAKDCMIVGQNIEFDLRFINKNMEELDIKSSFGRHAKLDLMAIAWPLVKGEIDGLSLAHLCTHFSISNIGAHGALVDCRRAFGVYKCLMRTYGKLTS